MDWNEPEQPHPAQSGSQGEPASRLLSRRRFLGRAGATATALAVAGPVLAACGTTSSSSSASSGKPTGNRKKIGFSQPDTSASIWGPLMAGAMQECQARGYELLESHANSKLDAQLSQIQTWIAEGVGAIVALPLDTNPIVPLIPKPPSARTNIPDYPHT